MSGIAVTMVMVLVIRQYAAGGWNGASETESALDDARDAYMHACMHMGTVQTASPLAYPLPHVCGCVSNMTCMGHRL